jgi:hypothetical protein
MNLDPITNMRLRKPRSGNQVDFVTSLHERLALAVKNPGVVFIVR